MISIPGGVILRGMYTGIRTGIRTGGPDIIPRPGRLDSAGVIMIHGVGAVTAGIITDIIIPITITAITAIIRITAADTAIIPTMRTATETGMDAGIPTRGELRDVRTGSRDFPPEHGETEGRVPAIPSPEPTG